MGFYDVRIKKTFFECPRLVIYSINSAFNKKHSLDAEVKYLNTELDIDVDAAPTFMDMMLEIENANIILSSNLQKTRWLYVCMSMV